MEQAALSPEMVACAMRRWMGIWGDPVFVASISMLLYGLAGLLLLRVARRTDTTDRRLWLVCAMLFFFQTLNVHLDLHALVPAVGHCVAQAQGWYENRGPVKLMGMAAIGAVTALVLVVTAVLWWRSIRANALLVAGVAIALGFTLIKGTAVNPIERVYNQTVGPFRWADLIEYGGILLASLAALGRLRRLRRGRPVRRRPALRGR